jgi:hypothetical protein
MLGITGFQRIPNVSDTHRRDVGRGHAGCAVDRCATRTRVMTSIAKATIAALGLAVCAGCSDSSPTTPSENQQRAIGESTLDAPILANSSGCYDFRVAWEGPVSVDISPAPFGLDARTGSCNQPGRVLATSATGSLNAVTTPVGDANIRIIHTGANDTRYRLVVRPPR